MSDKPREFWLDDLDSPEPVIFNQDDIRGFRNNWNSEGYIHVIEHAAYLAVIKERDELKQKLSSAVEALGEYQNHIIKVEGHSVHLGTKAREALEKIKPDGREE